MKKAIFLILACSGWSLANNIPLNVGVGPTTVHTETQGGVENQVIEMVGPNGSTATITTIGLKVDLTTTSVANSTVGVVGALSNNGAAAATNRVGVLDAVAQNLIGNNGTAFTQGRDAALSVGTIDNNLHVTQRPNMTNASYVAAISTFAVANSTSDFSWVCGSVKSTATVTGCSVSCIETTAAQVNLQIVKRSTAYTYGGQISTITATATDSNYSTTNSTANYTTNLNLTNGTAVGTALDSVVLGCNAPATTSPNDYYACPRSWTDHGITLRGPNQCIGMNLNGTAFVGGKVAVRWEWLDGNTP